MSAFGPVCEHCGESEMAVVDSRKVPATIRRRRYCPRCGQRTTTYEFAMDAQMVATFRKLGALPSTMRTLAANVVDLLVDASAPKADP
jgi:hypothetical protein